MRRWEGSRALQRGRGVCRRGAERRGSGRVPASARGLFSNRLSGSHGALSLTAQARQLRSAPRETRTPTRHTPGKALNLAGGALVVSAGVQIVRSKAKAWTGWTTRNDVDV